MKKVLVISDNIELVTFFKDLTKGKLDYKLDYSFSALNKNPSSLLEIGMSAIDVKDSLTIDRVIDEYDLVISAHCKQIFPSKLVNNMRCINIHPGLNPYNRGWFPQVFSIINKLPIGCTIHEMDEEIDHGRIIFQKEIFITPCDTSLDVYNKVQDAEKSLLSKHFDELVYGKYKTVNAGLEGNYNGIKDFQALCELDLNNKSTLSEHINLLRALTHEPYKNAYFFDGDGQKVYVSIKLETKCEN